MILPKSWAEIAKDEIKKPYFIGLTEFLENEYKNKIIYPAKNEIFSAFEVDYDAVKLVILGQDPYINEGQAHGLSFSVKNSSLTPSLKNIFKEIESQLGITMPKNGNLSHWVKQGVFLLNSILTVEQGKSLSHKNQGWEKFTDFIIQELDKREKPIVFMLWGNFAIKKAQLIKNLRHLILKSAHPSPLSCKKFFGNGHFLRANEFLSENNSQKKNIDLFANLC